MALRRGRLTPAFLAVLLLAVAWAHVWLAPYTKVEESFSLQAVHDILAFGIGPYGREKFDHVVFPGAVPRSFVGPLVLAITSYPFLLLGKWLRLVRTSADAGLLVRLFLSTGYALSILLFAVSTIASERPSGKLARGRDRQILNFFLLITVFQFTNLFWAGRTTPNGVVAPLVNVALTLLLTPRLSGDAERRARNVGIGTLVVTAVIARAELVGLLFPSALLVLEELVRKPARTRSKGAGTANLSLPGAIVNLVAVAATFGLVALISTVLLDTYMWGRNFSFTRNGLLWPELEAIVFNVVEGKSSEWGVSPFREYAVVHLPKLLSFPGIFAAVGIAKFFRPQSTHSQTMRKALFTACSHVLLLSFLRHKEARFISYTVPLFNLVAATGAAEVWRAGRTWMARWVCRLAALAIFLATAALTSLSVAASMVNYPGGEALAVLHAVNASQSATVHVDVLPAMTGVSLFQSIFNQNRSRPGSFGLDVLPSVLPLPNIDVLWAYDKTEGIYENNSEYQRLIETFTYLVSDDKNCHNLPGFKMMDDQAGRPLSFAHFDGVKVVSPRRLITHFFALFEAPSKAALSNLWPVQIRRKDVVWLCERVVDGT